jgi:dTMP kinase
MFVTVEGIEGSGKSTQLRRLAAWLAPGPEPDGAGIVVTREPGGSRLGQELRRILLDVKNKDLTSQAELFLYLADRAQHVSELIRPSLEAGRIVLSDRYADSTVVYQGYGRGLDPDLLARLCDLAVQGLWPDLTLLFDLPARQGLSRAQARNAQTGNEAAEGRFEAERLDFHVRVREGYLAWAERHKDRFLVIDGSGDEDTVWRNVLAAVEPRLSGLRRPAAPRSGAAG